MSHLLSIRNLCVSYHDNLILEDLNFDLEKGEIHAIIGQNATGKTTFAKILSGLLPQQSGQIYFQGQDISQSSVSKRQKLGIWMVSQNLFLFENLTVAENIFFDQLPFTIHHRELIKKYHQLIEKIKIKLPAPDTLVSSLGAGQKKIIQVIRGFVNHPKILILDEPSVFFTSEETSMLFEIMRQAKNSGSSIIFITNRQEEIYQIADQVSILFDGKLSLASVPEVLDPETMLKMIAGKDHTNRYPKIHVKKGSPLLSIRHLYTDFIEDFNLTLYAGEIVAITGIVGAYKSHLARAIVGIDPAISGSVYANRASRFIHTVRDATFSSIGYLSEEFSSNLFGNFSGARNITITSLQKCGKRFWLSRRFEDSIAKKHFENFVIRRNIQANPSWFSGGEKQKICLSRVFCQDADVLIIDEPTQWVDVPSKVDVYNLFNDYISKEKAILMVSSDLSEVCGIADRVIVLKDGKVSAELSQEEISEKNIHLTANTY